MCLRGAVDYLKNYKQRAEECKQIFKDLKKSTASQMHFGFTIIPFTFANVQMEHPVVLEKMYEKF